MATGIRKRTPAVIATPPPRSDWIVAGLALAGMAVAGYLSWIKLSGGNAAFCLAGGGCDLVQASRYAALLGVPTAVWGFAVYVAIGALAISGFGERRWLAAFLLAAGGVGFSLYLTGLSIFDLGATCVWCLTSGVILVGILIVLLRRRPEAGRRKSPLRARQLATYAIVAAIGTTVAGAFVFAAPASMPPGYALALARHLAETKAVMYGAFW